MNTCNSTATLISRDVEYNLTGGWTTTDTYRWGQTCPSTEADIYSTYPVCVDPRGKKLEDYTFDELMEEIRKRIKEGRLE